MTEDKELLTDIQDAIANCMKCGNCMEVCPIYKELNLESQVARGKLALIEAVLTGKADITEGFDKRLAMCLSCKACADKCPCGVKADELILRGRQAAVKARGLHPIKKNVFKLLSNRKLFDFTLRMAGLFGPLQMKKLPRRMAAIARFPVPGLDRKRVLAPFAATPLLGQFPTTVKVANPKMKVAFFAGCTINYVYTDIGQSAINVLKANDVEVILPALQHCCGTPVYMAGDVDMARAFAKHNIETFAQTGADYIVAACGSCAEAFKLEYPEMFHDDPVLDEQAKNIAAKTYEISEFLTDVLHFRTDSLGTVNSTVTVHDPCHMARGLKVIRQPREILKAIPGLKIVEMKEPARCCGAGGSFSLANYEISRKINDRKIADIRSTNADTVATSCGSCRMHITDGLVQNSMQQECFHVVQLLDKAYQAGTDKKREIPRR
ncbi:Lactate utilization protein A [Sporomusa ovata DSM 2662]|uniref:Glycolate oxidase iron-sulfur subunit n=1 Tax=Sporomusa ovata TaxID=2378 RepID=A0A0U1L041_9FIRM|nr:(Fe-S)-binding protein [Sporomusa ovata]EQB28870.1 glycolate oxidase iron-sulfur subunit [Sporomusa ovata DSM 2662]CQR72294.1 Glycolate dehydrogenase, iron-sulfur subunit GlcF [Sporomusa ovata]